MTDHSAAHWRGTCRVALVGLFACASTSAAIAAGFDCNRASSVAEKMVCGDAILSRRDDWLSSLYARAIQATQDGGLLRQQQRRWISSVRDPCSSRLCLSEAYDARGIENLNYRLSQYRFLLPELLQSSYRHPAVREVVADMRLLLSSLDTAIAKEMRETLDATLQRWNFETGN